MNNLVSIKYLDSYDNSKVENAVRELFANLNLFDKIRPKMKVMLKICLSYSASPDSAEISHPAIIRGIVNVLSEMGVSCVIADSPIGKYTVNHLDSVYLDSGMLEVANMSKCELNRNLKTFTLELPDGIKTKSLTLLDVINNVDAIINISKIKVDENLGLIASTSNIFGLIPGDEKCLILNRLNTLRDYNEFLCDMVQALNDKLLYNIVDGVVALEDNKTQHMLSFIAGGENTFSLDAVVAKIVNKDIKDTICDNASKRGLIDINNPYKIVGDNIDSFISTDFKLNNIRLDHKLHKSNIKRKLYFKKNQERVKISPKTCKGCSICSKNCPSGAIIMKTDKNGELYAYVDYNKCIFCNKCYEICPYKVVEKITPYGYKQLQKQLKRKNKKQQNKENI